MASREQPSSEAVGVLNETLENFDCQPVLFVGAGLARRYIGAPNWDGALKAALSVLGSSAPEYSYLVQKYQDNKIAVGTHIGDLIFEWAWSEGKSTFDEKLFVSKDRYVFIKHILASFLKDLSDGELDTSNKMIASELTALAAIRPHAIITTNYDDTLEKVFEGYEPIVGGGVLKYNLNSFGEIFHIHGSVSEPSSIIIAEPDYKNWAEESRYFASKLLTYFVEHPVFILGYGSAIQTSKRF